MPVFNSEKYLAESIESILNQSFTNFELIIVNDGSTDKSANIIKNYLSDNRLVFIDRKENKKLVYTLNEGLKNVQGKYIARMDADDISLPERFEKQYEFLQKNPDIMLVGSSYISFNEKNEQNLHTHPKNPVEIAYRFISNTYFCHPSVMFRSQIIGIIGDYKNVEAEDFHFFSKVVCQFPCSNLNIPLILYRVHDSNRSLTHKKELMDSVHETTKNNVNVYFTSEDKRKTYFEYRTHQNRNSKQIILCFFYDMNVVLKIIKKYRNPFYIFYGCSLISKIALQNVKSFVNKAKKVWS